jgi:hypothetical protein
MYGVPFAISDTEYSIFLILLDENIDRIKAYGPASFSTFN